MKHHKKAANKRDKIEKSSMQSCPFACGFGQGNKANLYMCVLKHSKATCNHPLLSTGEDFKETIITAHDDTHKAAPHG